MSQGGDLTIFSIGAIAADCTRAMAHWG